ncbi:hypothetical protein ABSL23_01125 (plasmid) [Halobacterium sp. NMX12-1]|uniref:Uncharacterized protein n=1 Tax=Halobacterium sp. NMX12-1 TaxID=3166650 RepID=A0AAU8C8R1_9EURY
MHPEGPDSETTRRAMLAAVGGGMVPLAGCSALDEMTREELDDSSSSGAGNSDSDDSTAGLQIHIEDIRPGEIDVTIDNPTSAGAGVLLVDTSPDILPNHPSSSGVRQTVVDEVVQLPEETTTRTFEVELDQWYAQRFHATFEYNVDGDPRDVTTVTEDCYFPYYNAVEDREAIRNVGPSEFTEEDWSAWDDSNEQVSGATSWWTSPETSEYNVPDVDADEFPPDVYQYNNVRATFIVRMVVYMDDEDGRTMRKTWFGFNLELSDWEMIEARRWNSPSIIAYERGSQPATETTPMSWGESMISGAKAYGHRLYGDFNANLARTPYQAYQSGLNGFTPIAHRWPDENREQYRVYRDVNALQGAGGRPIAKRLATKIEDALAPHPMNPRHPESYWKATALKAWLGSSGYDFESGDGKYHFMPEELLDRWYRDENLDEDVGGNCVDTSLTYAGIAVHLLEESVGYSSVDIEGWFGHAVPLIFGLEHPEELPDHVPFRGHRRERKYTRLVEAMTLDSDIILSDGDITRQETGDWTLDDYGLDELPASVAESTSSEATVGYENATSDHSFSVITFARGMQINSHIPLNSAFEPDAEGDVVAPDNEQDPPF